MSNVKYREVKRVAEVGEKIKVVNAVTKGSYVNGDVMNVVKSIDTHVCVDRDWINWSGQAVVLYHSEYVVLEPIVEPSKQPLFEAFTQFIRSNADAVRALLDEEATAISTSELSATPKKLTRGEVIELAKADVAELVRVRHDLSARLPEGKPFRTGFCGVKFDVNRKKRAVTCLIFERYMQYVPRMVGVAKCAPNDVFHAEIGKAIAIRRALGLLIPEEYTEAPKPKEPLTGAVVYGNQTQGYYSDDKRFTLGKKLFNDAFYYEESKSADFIFSSQIGEIIDDTNVNYNAIETEGVAA